MEYSEFKDKVLESIKEQLPDTLALADVSIREVIKNNDTILDGISINDHTGKPMPTIYLNDAYKDMTENGRSFGEILKSVVNTIVENMRDLNIDISAMTKWENVKDHVVPRVINKAKNKELVKGRPHMDITDLTKVYAVNLQDGMSIPITNELMETWRVSLSDLDESATSNITGQSKFRGISEILMEMMGEDILDTLGINSGEADNMYFLSNDSGLYGAAQMLDINLMDNLTSRFPDGFVILPSSTHEVIIVPIDGKSISNKELEDIVRQVNSTAVSAADFLSDNIYKYNNNTHSIERIDLKNSLTHAQDQTIGR